MNQTKQVPFSWEKEPGVSKTKECANNNMGQQRRLKLQPPPCPVEKARAPPSSVHDIQIPLPPCTFQLQQPPSRSSSRKGSFKKDPFLVALKECTKNSSTNGRCKSSENDEDHVSSGLKKKVGLFNFSCKHSCSVVDDNSFVKTSLLPSKKNEEAAHNQ